MNPAALGSELSGEAIRRQKRVVRGIQDQGRHLNEAEESVGRTPSPIFLRIGESMHRGGEGVVDLSEGALPARIDLWDQSRKQRPLEAPLAKDVPLESSHVRPDVRRFHGSG